LGQALFLRTEKRKRKLRAINQAQLVELLTALLLVEVRLPLFDRSGDSVLPHHRGIVT
jgi:hypothetical protein